MAILVVLLYVARTPGSRLRAYGTLFDVHSVISTCNELFPEKGSALSQLWRAKQLEYTWLRSLMGRYEDFWQVTESALIFARRRRILSARWPRAQKLMDAYLHLDPFPEVRQALQSLSRYKLGDLSNGSPRMLAAVVESAGLKRVRGCHQRRRSEDFQAGPACL